MTARIQLRRSFTAGAVPTTGQIWNSELAYNVPDGKLYAKKTVNGVESIILINSSGGGSTDPDPVVKCQLTTNNQLNSTATYTRRNVFNTSPAFNVGGFTVSSTGIEVPSAGKYVCLATIFVTNDREKADVGVAFGINDQRQFDALAATGYTRDRDGHEESSTNLTSVYNLTAGDEINLFFARIARSGSSNVELQTTSNVSIFKLV
jgi:hypothetical protein